MHIYLKPINETNREAVLALSVGGITLAELAFAMELFRTAEKELTE